MVQVRTSLWFDGGVDEAADFYVSLIPGSRIVASMPYVATEDAPGEPPPEGESLTVEIELAGARYTLLNGGPMFPQSEAVSIEVVVDSQEEIDRLWEAIVGGGGQESACGWCRDRWGVSWQIVPRQLYELLQGPHARAVTTAMLATWGKLDIAHLEAAAQT